MLRDPNPFTDKRFDEGSEDYRIPFLVRGVVIGDRVRWKFNIEGDQVIVPEGLGSFSGGSLVEVLERVIELIKETDSETEELVFDLNE